MLSATSRTPWLPAPARVSRAHQTRFLPGGVVVTTDLGFDLVRFWTSGPAGLRLTQEVTLPRGCGPRHTVWHPSGHLYVVTELSLEVFVLASDPAASASERWRVVGSAPLGAGTAPGSDFAAEIALTRDAAYAVVGIRGSNTLATVRVRDGGRALALVALAESSVDWPRHHVIERDTVLVAGQLGWFAPPTVDAAHANIVLIALAMLALAITGAADNVSAIYRSTMMQAAVPDTMRGRLQGVFMVVVAGGPRIGALYAGALATLTALWVPPLVGGFVIVGLVALLVRRHPRFRAYDAEHPVP